MRSARVPWFVLTVGRCEQWGVRAAGLPLTHGMGWRGFDVRLFCEIAHDVCGSGDGMSISSVVSMRVGGANAKCQKGGDAGCGKADAVVRFLIRDIPGVCSIPSPMTVPDDKERKTSNGRRVHLASEERRSIDLIGRIDRY